MGKSNPNPNLTPHTPSWLGRAWAWLTVRNCGGCGACCSTCGHPPFSNEEIRRNKERDDPTMPLSIWNVVWAEVNAITSGMGLSRCAAKLPCSQWSEKTRRCAIHQYRPAMCREYPIRCGDYPIHSCGRDVLCNGCLSFRKDLRRTWRTWPGQIAFALGRLVGK